jgi:hypothetical protein
MEAIGTADPDFLKGLLEQLGKAAAEGQVLNEHQFNFMLSIVKDIEPRDQLEAMLAAQMASTHNAIMTFARRLNDVENIPNRTVRSELSTNLHELSQYRWRRSSGIGPAPATKQRAWGASR